MKTNNNEKVIDVTDVELKPGDPDHCQGNGEHGYECCCDNCDYLATCFADEIETLFAEENPNA